MANTGLSGGKMPLGLMGGTSGAIVGDCGVAVGRVGAQVGVGLQEQVLLVGWLWSSKGSEWRSPRAMPKRKASANMAAAAAIQ